jgi:hypothetical protein
MWQQLSGFDKFRLVGGVLVTPPTFLVAIADAMEREWVGAAIKTFLGFYFVYLVVQIVSSNRPASPREPQTRTINPGTPESGAGPAAFTGGTAKLPLAAWLYFGGFAADMIAGFLPYWTGNADEKARSGGFIVAELIVSLVMYGAFALLVWATFNRPRPRRGPLIALTVWIGFWVFHVIGDWTLWRPASGSPAAGLFLDTAATIFLAVRVVMDWIARSKNRERGPSESIPAPS